MVWAEGVFAVGEEFGVQAEGFAGVAQFAGPVGDVVAGGEGVGVVWAEGVFEVGEEFAGQAEGFAGVTHLTGPVGNLRSDRESLGVRQVASLQEASRAGQGGPGVLGPVPAGGDQLEQHLPRVTCWELSGPEAVADESSCRCRIVADRDVAQQFDHQLTETNGRKIANLPVLPQPSLSGQIRDGATPVGGV